MSAWAGVATSLSVVAAVLLVAPSAAGAVSPSPVPSGSSAVAVPAGALPVPGAVEPGLSEERGEPGGSGEPTGGAGPGGPGEPGEPGAPEGSPAEPEDVPQPGGVLPGGIGEAAGRALDEGLKDGPADRGDGSPGVEWPLRGGDGSAQSSGPPAHGRPYRPGGALPQLGVDRGGPGGGGGPSARETVSGEPAGEEAGRPPRTGGVPDPDALPSAGSGSAGPPAEDADGEEADSRGRTATAGVTAAPGTGGPLLPVLPFGAGLACLGLGLGMLAYQLRRGR
ncbi:hypothetical protein [Streptomyces sp. YIM 98790]|uniref:hypothetical protein n=1 Tax=Streptomyces sp. YIM 98790 TaxID=2689077 RepID=UPI001408942C|nr:hypothetical protein [Streptomyces sp. YIM 98790]